MAKRRKRMKKTQTKRGTNWFLIGGIVIVGAVGLFALLYLALREPERQSLAEYCQAADGNCVFYGEQDAPVTFIEVSDFGCPHCRDFHQNKSSTIKERFVDSGLVRWVFLPYALRPDTVPAANAAMCAHEQGKYLEFAESLFNKPTIEEALTRDGFLASAEEVGLDGNSFASCIADGRYNQTISTNQQAARTARVSATPTFFVNDQIVRGNVPLEQIEQLFSQHVGS